MKKAFFAAVTCVVILLLTGIVFAAVLDDPVFDSAHVSLSTAKTASFYAETFTTASSIRVTSVKLYKKVGSTWSFVKTLSAPSHEATNNCYFSTSADYSTDIGSGTFRLKATFSADGYSTDRYSNERTY